MKCDVPWHGLSSELEITAIVTVGIVLSVLIVCSTIGIIHLY